MEEVLEQEDLETFDKDFDTFLNILENDNDDSSSEPSSRKRTSDTTPDDTSYECAKKPKLHNNDENANELSDMRAKMLAMEKEMTKLKEKLGTTKEPTNQHQTMASSKSQPVSFKSSKRIAHESTGIAKPPETLSSRQPGIKPRPSADWETKSDIDTKDCVTDRFSSLRIRNPLISLELMEERMRGRMTVRIPQIEGKVKDGDIEGDWVTIGVVVSKSLPKDTCKGKKFSVWRLSDLSSQSASISLFLFDKVFQAHWKMPVGHVVAILNPSIRTNEETNSSTGISFNCNKYSLSLDNPAKLMDMGVSYDFVMCKAIAKSGKPCQNYASRQHGGCCDYHVQKEYNKARSGRMNCQGGYGPTAQNLQKKVLGKTGVMYGGQLFNGGGGGGGGGKRSKIEEKRSREAQRMFVPGARREMREVEELLGTACSSGRRPSPPDRTGGDDMFKQLMSGNTPGARCLNKHLNKEKTKTSAILEKEKSALDLLQEHASKKPQPKTSPTTTSRPVKKKEVSLSTLKDFELFKPDNFVVPKVEVGVATTTKPTKVEVGVVTTTTPPKAKPIREPLKMRNTTLPPQSQIPSVKITLDGEKLKKRAMAAIRDKGSLRRNDPNGIVGSKMLSAQQQENIKKMLHTDETSNNETQDSCDKENEITDEEIQKILNTKSSHDWIVTKDDNAKQETYFGSLEKKEELQERLSQITELNVRVVQCSECNYISESVGSRCRGLKHSVTRLRAMKRCFKCGTCGQRTFTYNERFPRQLCQCGESKFQKCSIYKEKSGPKLPSEVLLLRGHEQKFLNSLN